MKLSLKIILLLVLSFVINSHAQMFGQEPDERKRTYDVEEMKIEVKLDLDNKIVTGKVTTSFRSLVDKLSDFEIDAVGMNIKSVKGWYHNATDDPKLAEGFEDLKFDYDKKKITVHVKGSVAKNFPYKYQIEWTATDPEKGMYFIQPVAENQSKPFQVWTQGEGEDNRYWLPCYDYPNDKAMTEMFITIDSKYQTLSNGALLETNDNGDGTKTWHWKLNHPHSSYLIMLAAGNWDIVEDSWSGIPVLSYVPVGTKDWSQKSFDRTSDMVKFFSEQIGFTYPWERYSQIVVEDFIYGGMENTSATVLTNVSIYDSNIPPDYSAMGLVAHELVHQWWGDVLTCKNWNEIWTNESFATYFDALYVEHAFGKDEFDYKMMRNADGPLWADKNIGRKPIWNRDGLTVNTYDKGSCVLNMLRNTLGDEKFWKVMNLYITKNQFQNVTTENLYDAVNEVLNPADEDHKPIEMHWFFDEWIYKAGQPEYDVSYDWNDAVKELTLNVKQTQRLDTSSIFRTPVDVGFVMPNFRQKDRIEMQGAEFSRVYVLEEKPLCVVFNIGNKVLSRLNFSKPKEDWLNQLKLCGDAVDRINAIRGLKTFIDEPDVQQALRERLQFDDFWGVRKEGVDVFSNSKADFLEFYKGAFAYEPDSRVKRTFLDGLNKLKDHQEWSNEEYRKSVKDFLTEVMQKSDRDYIIGDAIGTLGNLFDNENLFDVVVPYLERESHGNIIRRNVLEVIKKSDDVRCKDIFIEYSSKKYPTRMRDNSFNGLEKFLSDQSVVDYLNKNLDDHFRSTRFTILRLLEKAKSPSSKPYLETLLKKTNDDDLKKRINEVISKIN